MAAAGICLFNAAGIWVFFYTGCSDEKACGSIASGCNACIAKRGSTFGSVYENA
jgi:hypothetical protein